MQGVFGRLFPFLASFVVLLVAAPATSAQESSDGPALREASVRVSPGQGGTEVTERLAVTGAGGESIDHVLARFGSAEVEDLTVRSGNREPEVSREPGELVENISIPVPANTTGGFEYEVSYTYSAGTEAGRVPLVVPTAPTTGDAAVVTVDLTLPQGRYLGDSFPVMESSGEGGVSGARMTSFPGFVSYEVGTSPVGILTAANAYTALVLALIVGCVFVLLLYDRRSGRGEEVARA